jgi:gentisate 1,2-dioxygenase
MSDDAKRPKESTRYQQLIERRDEERRRIASAGVCVKGGALPWEVNPQGVMKWYMHPQIETTAHKFLIFQAQEIRAGSRSGKQRCQGGTVIVAVEGAGHTLIDGQRFDWKKGDVLQLPIKPEGVVFQHFNDGAETALLITAEANLVATTGVDRACGFEQLEEAPEYRSR